MSRSISLSQGKVTIIDDVDFEWANQWKWHAQRYRVKTGDLYYAVRDQYGPGNTRKNRVSRKIRMHREIAVRSGLAWSRYYDHADGDGLNNKRANIRPCTQSQNRANSQKRLHTSSQYKGVAWDKEYRRWRVGIMVSGKRVYLGRYTTEEAAHAAYAAAAKLHFGEFARA